MLCTYVIVNFMRISPDVLELLQMVAYNQPSNTCTLTPAHPVSVMDVDDSAHKVTSSLPLVPEDVQSFPSMFLIRDKVSRVISSQQKTKNVLLLVFFVKLVCMNSSLYAHNDTRDDA